jgi:hypothetical protein
LATEPDNTLDLLVHEDEVLRDLFDQWRGLQGADVEVRYERGTVEKILLEHVAVREAAKHYLGEGLGELGHQDLAARVVGDLDGRIGLIDDLDHLMSGVQPMGLGPDVTEAVGRLADTLGPEIDEDLGQVVPDVRAAVSADQLTSAFKDPRYVRRHAPLHPATGHWWEGWGPLERAHAIYDRLRSEPGGAVRPSSETTVAERLGHPLEHLANGTPGGPGEPTHDPREDETTG